MATYVAATNRWICADNLGGGDLKSDGTVGLSAHWNAGAFNITAASFIGVLTGNASTASALAADPANCAAGQLSLGITAAGVAECSATPSLQALTLYGANSLALGTSRTNDGKIIISSGTALNDYLFTIVASNFASNLTWTLPTAAPGGANYLLNVDADGTMGYTDPAGLGGGYTNLTSFVAQTAWRLFYSDGSGDVKELALGADGTFLRGGGATAAPAFAALPVPTTITVADEAADASSFPLFVTAATGDLGPKTDTAYTYDPTTGTLGATKFAGAFNGTVGATTPAAGTFTSVTVAKSSGVAGDMGLYEANSTDTHAAGFRGPASITGDGAYRILFPNARAAAAGQVLSVTNAGESGSGTAADPYVQTGSWATPATADSSTTFTEKTFDVDGTNNVLKTWGYIVLTHPHLCAAGAPMQTTSTANTFGQCKFGNATDKATNYAEYYLVVPPDIDTSVDLVGTFKLKLGGADTGDHEYEISFDSVADSAAYAGSLGDAVSLAFTADASGADADVETAGPTTLTGWKDAMTASNLFVVRVARDGDHANDGSSVDSYSGPLVIKYKKTQ
jgi:hypothetical protein